MESNIEIRWMQRRDVSRVLELENQVHQWEALREEQLLGLLRDPELVAKVIEIDGVLLGHLVYRNLPHSFQIEVLTVGEGPRRSFCSEQLLSHLADKLGYRRCQLEMFVDERDLDTLGALKQLGWRGELWRDLDGQAGDRVRMVYGMPQPANPQKLSG